MSHTAIRVRNLVKAYRIGEAEQKADTLAGALKNTFLAPIRNYRRLKSLSSFKDEAKTKHFAINDISFDIKHGEVVGILGRNGAGKSTLLKILSRITDPTSGRIEVFGRISSLLEVGTGFHPELTGRENVYLNGTILGMRKSEIDSKFEEIVEFAGISKFIDTPVKRYSSGMRVRLAFSVAAHLNAEILLIDEVLAVGDVEFQKKCLGKMNDVAQDGRTVLFVSHNMGAVKELCQRGIVLDKGGIIFDGHVNNAINHYMDKMQAVDVDLDKKSGPISAGQIMINGSNQVVLEPGNPFKVELPVKARNQEKMRIILLIEDYSGRDVVNLSLTSDMIGHNVIDGLCNIEVSFPPMWLAPGIYSAFFKLLPYISDKNFKKVTTEKLFFEVKGTEEMIAAGFHSGKKDTMLAPLVEWNIGLEPKAVLVDQEN